MNTSYINLYLTLISISSIQTKKEIFKFKKPLLKYTQMLSIFEYRIVDIQFHQKISRLNILFIHQNFHKIQLKLYFFKHPLISTSLNYYFL
jgi:hypothetical protein